MKIRLGVAERKQKELTEKIKNRHTRAPVFYNNEQALRSVIRFAYISCIDEFMKAEELVSGLGYAEVVYIQKGSSMPVLLIELKWNRTVDGAIHQTKIIITLRCLKIMGVMY